MLAPALPAQHEDQRRDGPIRVFDYTQMDTSTRVLLSLALLIVLYMLQFGFWMLGMQLSTQFGQVRGTVSYYFVKAVVAQVNFLNGAKMGTLLITVAGGLIVAGVSWVSARIYERNKVAVMLDAAPRNYVAELDKLITQAVAEGKDKAVLNARAIVKVRNDLRNSLVTISTKLNSEIDRLAVQLGEIVPVAQGPSVPAAEKPTVSAAAAWETIQVLQKVWPAKKKEIEDAIRQILTEIGLNPNQYKKAA